VPRLRKKELRGINYKGLSSTAAYEFLLFSSRSRMEPAWLTSLATDIIVFDGGMGNQNATNKSMGDENYRMD
jgi:hypothetical protein